MNADKTCFKHNIPKEGKQYCCNGVLKTVWICKPCQQERSRTYYQNNRIKILEYQKSYAAENQTKISAYQEQYYQVHKDNIIQTQKERIASLSVEDRQEFDEKRSVAGKKYRTKHRDNINHKKRMKKATNIVYKLREAVSNAIYIGLMRKIASKKNGSCWKRLGYTPQDLWTHLENHPEKEPWMNRNNHGVYDPNTWNDNDDSTKTWQIDHIIPQSDLPFDSMDHPNFKKCWALENLRPYSAKLNIKNGNRR